MTTEQMLRTLTTPDLEHYRRALTLDRDGRRPSVARQLFCDDRIRIIDAILRERGHDPATTSVSS